MSEFKAALLAEAVTDTAVKEPVYITQSNWHTLQEFSAGFQRKQNAAIRKTNANSSQPPIDDYLKQEIASIYHDMQRYYPKFGFMDLGNVDGFVKIVMRHVHIEVSDTTEDDMYDEADEFVNELD